MKYCEYFAYVTDAQKYSDLGAFQSDIGYGPDVPYDGDSWQRVTEVIFAAAHEDIKTIVGEMSARAFAMKYALPERSVQNWVSGERSAPGYVISLIGYAVIGDIEQSNEEF